MELPLKEKIVYISNDIFVEVSCHDCGFYAKAGTGSKFKIWIHLLICSISLFLVYATIYSRVAFPHCDSLDGANNALEVCGIPQDALRKVDYTLCGLCDEC